MCWWCAAATSVHGQSTDRSQDEQAIRAAAEEYLDALQRGDGQTLAEFWMADGDVVDETGQSRPVRELIAQLTPRSGDEQRPEVKMQETKIRFLSDDVAIEDGISEASDSAGQTAARGRFSAIWVKKDGRWRMASLRESRIVPNGKPAGLADLSWLLGKWTAQNGETTLDVSVRWNVSETFLLRDLKVARGGKLIYQGSQRIGWDPLTHKLKAWTFDSDGGYGEGTWTKNGNSWVVRTTGVLPDGRQVLTSTIVEPDGPDHFKLTTNRSPGNAAPGGSTQIEFTRQKSKSE
jgi:uncharacterized protein (TIGR02246 family)